MEDFNPDVTFRSAEKIREHFKNPLGKTAGNEYYNKKMCSKLLKFAGQKMKMNDFEKIYKGEISKSGAAILPSKRVRKMPEKITTSPIIESKKEEKIEKIEQQSENEKNSAEKKTK